MDGFGSDTDEFESGYHLLPHFNSNTNTNPNLLEYEYKTEGSNLNLHRMFIQNQLKIIFLKFNLDE